MTDLSDGLCAWLVSLRNGVVFPSVISMDSSKKRTSKLFDAAKHDERFKLL